MSFIPPNQMDRSTKQRLIHSKYSNVACSNSSDTNDKVVDLSYLLVILCPYLPAPNPISLTNPSKAHIGADAATAPCTATGYFRRIQAASMPPAKSQHHVVVASCIVA